MAAVRSDVNTTRLLWAMAIACAMVLGLAMVAQERFDMHPCPWCVLQRLLYVVIGVACALAALVRSRGVRVGLAGASAVLGVAGVASALYQHLVAAQSYSCNLTLADRIVSGLQLDSLLPKVFSATAGCAEAAVDVLGVPFAYWSLAMFVLLTVCAVAVVGRTRRAA